MAANAPIHPVLRCSEPVIRFFVTYVPLHPHPVAPRMGANRLEGVFAMALRLSSLVWAGLRLGASASVLALAATSAYAQEVTGTIRGDVQDENGQPLAGATVTVTHVPSGTRSVQTTDQSGSFSAPNLRIGGPFDVTVAAPGFEAAKATVPSIQAGVPQRVAVVLVSEGAVIEVTAARSVSSITLSSGPATVLDARQISNIANVNRDIRNLAARDPLVNLNPVNGGLSIAGQNNRFNRITVDGVAFGDPFGLEAGGLASARGSVPLDAIGEFSVEVAPVDIQQGGFQGGAINTVLKSGGNSFFVNGFYTFSDDSLGGSRSVSTPQNPSGRIPRNFESRIFGGQITGPLIKDKLFFAVTYEGLRDTRPADIGIAGEGFANAVPNLTRAQVDRVKQASDSIYGLDAGDVPTNVEERDDKLVAKIDWNIADGHRAAFTYIYNKGNLLAGQGNSSVALNTPTLALESNLYDQGSINHYGVFQLNSEWTDNFSTQARVSYHDYERLQVPFSPRTFGQFLVCMDAVGVGAADVCPTGQSRVRLGPDGPRQANELFVKTLGIELQARITGNGHDVKFIAERRAQDITNLFGNRVSGEFYFDSVADLEAQRAGSLRIGPPIRGTIESITAEFQNNVYVFGVQDTWEINPALTVTYGARYDLYETPDRPFANPFFVQRYGFSNSSSLNGRGILQPRFAANWKANDRLQLRASAGLFAGGNPNVWISNNYSVTGFGQADITVRRTATGFTVAGISGLTAAEQNALGAATLNGVRGGEAVPAELIALAQRAGVQESTTNAIAPDFNIPSQWRIAGVVDYAANLGPLGDDWNLNGSVTWSRVKDALTWRDLRSVANTTQATLPDGRPRYQGLLRFADQNSDIVLENTNRGYSWNIVGGFDKAWPSGFSMSAYYTFQRVFDENPGTSSVAFSNYDGAVNLDPNNAAYGISGFQIDDAVRLRFGYDAKLFGDNSTRFELFFNSQAGQRFSYTMFENGFGRSPIFGVVGNRNRSLLYVPNVSSITADPIVRYADQATFEALRDLVQNSALNRYQGEVAPKNIGRSPRFNKLDFSVRQEIPFFGGGKVEVFADVENVLNLINRDWGALQRNPFRASVVDVSCVTAAGGTTAVANTNQPCAQYVYSSFRSPELQLETTPSLWQARIGVRLAFNGFNFRD